MSRRTTASRRSALLRAAFAAAAMACAIHAPAGDIGPRPAPAERLSGEEQAILCLDLQSIAALKTETAALDDMSARLLRMQAAVGEIRRLIEAMPAGGPAPAAPQAGSAAAPRPEPAELPWTLAVAAAGAIALLGLLWARRRGEPAAAAVPQIPLATDPAAAASPAAEPALRSARLARAGARKAVAADAAPVAPPVGPPPAAVTVAPAELPEIDQALELAEVMVSMGLTAGAAETLVDHIRAHPRRALYHWLKLLDIYRTSGSQEDFERSAAELRQHFNIQASGWLAAGGAPLRTLEDYGHLGIRVQELWQRPAHCIDYLLRLLADNRGGTRQGFPQSVAEEILCLIAVLREER